MIHKSILLTGLTLLPLASSSNLQAIANADYSTSLQVNTNDQETKENESCSVMYVGKNCSETGKAYIARTGDASPTGMNMNMQIFEHNQLANQTIKGKNGFEWTMPNETYRYTAFPRNPMMAKGLHWEVAGINENGVGVTATLSCGTSDLAKSIDPLCKTTGITEDNITQIVAATAKTAKEGIQTVAKIIDKVGSGEENAIMVLDKNEAWYMEMYTGHQYVAVKMPDDKCCTVGNEYNIETLKDYDDVITSADYYTLARTHDFAVYDGEAKQENLNLFKTYAEPLVDSCHMRTWRGINLYAKNNYPDYLEYKTNVKYPTFWKPDDKLSLNDIINYFRDQFEDILSNPFNVNYEYFSNLSDQHKLRAVGDETAYNVHIISYNPEFPAETALEEWFCLSNSKYAPFIPLSNGVTKLNQYYTHVTPYYGFDEESAVCIFKKLNTLAAIDHTHYGKPISEYIAEHEKAWQYQYSQLLSKIKDFDVNKQKEILTNYSLQIQKEALQMSNILYEDLLWHDINVTKSYYGKLDKLFKPFVSIEYYSYLYGWDYKKDGNIITLTQGNDTLTIDMDYKWGEGNKGSISLNGGTAEDTYVQIRYDIPYINYKTAQKYMAIKYKLRDINPNDYLNPFNHLVWIIPVAVGVPLIAAAIIVPVVLSKKYKKNKK